MECGDWVRVSGDAIHPFAGYDGEVVLICDDSVSVRIHTLTHGEQLFDLALVEYVDVFHKSELLELPQEAVTTFDIFHVCVDKWNRWLSGDEEEIP